MEDFFNKYIIPLNSADSKRALKKILAKTNAEEFELDYFIYGGQFYTSPNRPKLIYLSNFPLKWLGKYFLKKYIQIDPIVQHINDESVHLIWDAKMDWKDKKIKLFMEDAERHNMKSGVVWPIHHRTREVGFISLVSRNPIGKMESHYYKILPKVGIFTPHFHKAVRSFLEIENHSEKKLSNREIEALSWAAEGKTSWEISQIMNISERTVIYHLQKAMDKLGASNRQQAISIALTHGLIFPASRLPNFLPPFPTEIDE